MASTLLLADGNPTIQRIVAMTFAGQEFKVLSVNDGDEALSAIAAERPDIILADVAMPKRNGYDVAAFVKQRPDLAHIPVLLLAGALEPVDEARAIATKCDGVVVKPFEPQQVVARVRELVRGAKGHPTQTTPGVPRAIERLIASHPVPATPVGPDTQRQPPDRAHEAQETPHADVPPPKVVKHPSAPARSVPIGAARRAAPGDKPPDPVDDYLDRLDVAFGTIEPPSAAAIADRLEDDETEGLDVPTLSSVLGEFGREPLPASPDPLEFKHGGALFGGAPVEPPTIRPASPPAVPRPLAAEPAAAPDAPAPDSGQPTAANNPFDALIAADQQARDEEISRELAEAAERARPETNEALIDAVAARVLEKLAPSGVADLVSRVVADVAERLVREEIDRIRGRK